VEDAVQKLVDRDEIRQLTARYNRASDGLDAAAVLAVFTADGALEMRGGPDGDKTFAGAELAQLVAPTAGQRVHMTMDSIIEVDGDRATQECTLLLCTRSRRRGLAAIFTGRYSDELVRTDKGWRFARRVAHVDYANEAQLALANVEVGGR
jgi:ketosteroid isomerase-like protein